MAESIELFHQACHDFQVCYGLLLAWICGDCLQEDGAKQFLAEFPKRLDALWVTQQILGLPINSESTLCQFQAAIAMRQTLILHWSTYSEGNKNEIQTFIIQTILAMTKAAEMESAAVKVLCGAAAIVLKLRWTSITVTAEFLQGVMNLIKGKEDVHSKYSGLMMLQAVVEELNTSTATPLGMSVDYHKQCSSAFQKQYLLPCFVECVQMASWLVQSDTVSKGDGAVICFACLRTLNSIMAWDFEQHNRLGPRSVAVRCMPPLLCWQYSVCQNQDLRPGMMHTSIKPDASWSEMLADDGLSSWMPKLLLETTQRSAFTQNTVFVEEAHQFMLNLCSIRSNTFPRSPAGVKARNKFLHQLLNLLLPLLPRNDEPRSQQEQLILLSRSFDALFRTHACSDILSSSREMSAGEKLLQRLCVVMKTFLDNGSMSPLATDTPEQECCLRFLNVWERLCTPEVYIIYKGVSDVKLCEGVVEGAKDVFQHILSSELQLAAQNSAATAEDSPAGMDDVMMAYACVGRSSAMDSFCLLSQHLQMQQQLLTQASQRSVPIPETELEKMAFLAELSGCAVADDFYGEEPSVPLQLIDLSDEHISVDMDPIVLLSKSLINCEALLRDSSILTCLSVRVVECIVGALTRWAETYLVPTDVTTSNLMEMFGDNANGQAVVQKLCAMANTCLTSFPTEENLQKLVCDRMLGTLTRSREIRKHVMASAAWRDLMTAFSSLNPGFLQMQHKMGRHIAFALCLASDALEDETSRNQYLTQLLDHPGREVRRLASVGGLAIYGSFLLEILRGVTQATRAVPNSRKMLYTFLNALFQPLLKMLSLFDFDENFTCSILKLAAEIVDVHVLFLEKSETETLFEWALEMLRMFACHRRGLRPIEASEILLKEKENEQCRDIRAVLRLLKNITDRELAEQENTSSIDIAKVVLQGMELTIPLMTTNMLKFPKLCLQYFDLLSHLCELYPEKIAQLPSESLRTLMSTLDFGLSLSETRSLRIVLESLESLAKYQWESLKQRKSVLPNAIVPGNESFASYFIRSILRRLMRSDEGGNAISASASTLLLLFFTEQNNMSHILSSLISSVGSYPSMDTDIHALLSFEGHRNPLSPPLQEQFRERLYVFVKNVRQLTRVH